MTILWLVLVAMALSITSCLLLSPLAQYVGLVDSPGGRKQHSHATPLVGGLSMLATFLFVSTLLYAHFLMTCFSLALTATLATALGLYDDALDVNPRYKFLAQAGIIVIALFTGMPPLNNLGDLFGYGEVTLGLGAVPFTLFALLSMLNGVNMIDGVDGLAGGIAVIAVLGLILLLLPENIELLQPLAVLLGALVGFLLLNTRLFGLPRALIFMGDAGSLFVGFSLAWLFCLISQKFSHLLRPVTVLWLLAIPFYDLGYVVYVRLKRRVSLATAGRDHLHHALQDAGFTAQQTVAIIWSLAIVFMLVGLWGEKLQVTEYKLFIGWWMTLVAYSFALIKLSKYAA